MCFSFRHIFYLDIRKDFIENKLHTTIQQLYSLTALIAQIELGDLDPENGLSVAPMTYSKFLPSNCSLSSCDPNRPRQIRVRWRSGGSSDSNNSNSEQPGLDGTEQEQVKDSSNNSEVYFMLAFSSVFYFLNPRGRISLLWS